MALSVGYDFTSNCSVQLFTAVGKGRHHRRTILRVATVLASGTIVGNQNM